MSNEKVRVKKTNMKDLRRKTLDSTRRENKTRGNIDKAVYVPRSALKQQHNKSSAITSQSLADSIRALKEYRSNISG